jgi:acyl carrier protein
MSNVESEILDIIATKTSVERDKLSREARMEDLEIESLDVAEIMFAIEEKFDIEVPYNANETDNTFATIGDVITAVEKVVASKA